MIKAFVDGRDCTHFAFPQGDSLEREVAFCLWWAECQLFGKSDRWVSGFKYHNSPVLTAEDDPSFAFKWVQDTQIEIFVVS